MLFDHVLRISLDAVVVLVVDVSHQINGPELTLSNLLHELEIPQTNVTIIIPKCVLISYYFLFVSLIAGDNIDNRQIEILRHLFR